MNKQDTGYIYAQYRDKVFGFVRSKAFRSEDVEDLVQEVFLKVYANLDKYEHIFMSRVFTFTNLPDFYTKAKGTADEAKFHIGGTGFYANKTKITEFRKNREEDFHRLEYDEYLNILDNHRGGHKQKGIDMARQMPYYHLYDDFVEQQVKAGFKREKYKDYQKYYFFLREILQVNFRQLLDYKVYL